MAVYFTHVGEIPQWTDFAFSLFFVICLLAVRCLLLWVLPDKIGSIVYTIMLGAALFGMMISVIFRVKQGGCFYPLFFFLLISELMYGLLIPVAASDPGTPLRYASLAGFCYTLPVALIAAVPLSEGECIEDFFSGRISDNKRKQ